MSLDSIINEILTDCELTPGDYFDSHTVINELIANKKFHETYLNSFPKGYSVTQYHSLIARKIEESGLAEKANFNGENILVKTHTIYGRINKNQLWKRR